MDEGVEAREKVHSPRFCPICGARVAEGAKTCLMCGADLTAVGEVEAVEASPLPRRKLTRRQAMILGGAAVIILIAAVIVGLATPKAAPAPMESPTPTFSPSPTATPTVVLTPTPTSPPPPTPTPIPPQSYIVQQGDTLLSIATQFGLTVDELRAYNGMDSDIIVVGQELLIPPPTPTPGPTPTWDPSLPTPTLAPFILHTVQQGDTLSTIAEKYGVTVDDIRRANNLGENDTVIRAGQVLQIPQYTPTPIATPEIVRAGTPTPRPLYPAPILLYPPSGATFHGRNAGIVLQWASVGILAPDESYRLTLHCPSIEGEEETIIYQQATLWRVPAELFPPQEAESRQCRWTVEVIRREGKGAQLVSQPGEERSFLWLASSP